MASIARHHAEWLSLVEVSGPFLSMEVLQRVFRDLARRVEAFYTKILLGKRS